MRHFPTGVCAIKIYPPDSTRNDLCRAPMTQCVCADDLSLRYIPVLF